jgi:hypothetical protein
MKYEYFSFAAAILDFRLLVMSGSIADVSVQFLDFKNNKLVAKSAEISPLTAVEIASHMAL